MALNPPDRVVVYNLGDLSRVKIKSFSFTDVSYIPHVVSKSLSTITELDDPMFSGPSRFLPLPKRGPDREQGGPWGPWGDAGGGQRGENPSWGTGRTEGGEIQAGY